MQIISKKTILENICQAWLNQYPLHNCEERFKIIYQKLISEKDLTIEKINQIIGNDDWTTIICHECEKNVDKAILLGEDSNDFDANRALICLDCLVRAYDKLNHG